MSEAAGKVVQTLCGFCHTNCGMMVSVKEGKIARIRGNPSHPANLGRLCPKGAVAKELIYSPQRLRYPLKKTAGGFKQISWGEALDTIASKLIEIRQKHGPESLVVYRGAPVNQEVWDGFLQLQAAYGSPNRTGPGHLCHVPIRLAQSLTYGGSPEPDFENTKCMMIWGANPTDSNRLGDASHGRVDRVIPEAKRKGAKLIVVDPVRTGVASMADEWLQINPGSDAALALAMLNVIIEEKLYDKEFVDGWTIGFAELAEHIRQRTPLWAEKLTGIPAARIEKIARMYATTKPALVYIGNGIDQYLNVVQTSRAISLLSAITGNVDVPGGNTFYPSPRLSPYPTLHSGGKRLGDDDYPLFPSVSFPAVVDALLSGKPYQPRAMIVNHGNPLLINANQTKVREALKKLELLVVLDVFPSATAQLADIVLPAACDLERISFKVYSSTKGAFVALQQKVVDPPDQCRPWFEVEYELAKRMELDSSYPWNTGEEWVNYRLKPTGVGVEDLKKQPVIYVTPPVEYRKYLRHGFDTPSRKIELYSEKLKSYGYEPLPVYRESALSIASQPDLAARYPLVGITRRPGAYVHTRFRNLPSLRKREPDCFVGIHPQDAQERGITEGEPALVQSPGGSIKVKARVTSDTRPGQVIVDFGWGNPWDGGQNVNILTSDEARDPISSATSNRRFLCEVRKA